MKWGRRGFLKLALIMGGGAMHALHAPGGFAMSHPAGGLAGRIRSIQRRDETILRLGGLGDGYKMSWGADNRQFVVVNDGPGWRDPPKAFYNSRLWTVAGPPRSLARPGGRQSVK